MRRPATVVLVAAAIALAYGLYAAGSRVSAWMKGPEPGSRPWQVQEFRKDWKACDRFAGKREDARKLLAWKPKPWVNTPGTEAWNREYAERRERERAESEANLRNLDADMAAVSARWQADEHACLRDIGWPDIQIETLKNEIREADKTKRR